MKTTFRIDGGKEMARNLELFSRPVSRRILREALREGGEPMRSRMSQLAPYDPTTKTHLRDKIRIGHAVSDRETETAVAVGPTTKGFYGSFQELGTQDHAAQPFARPAFDGTVMSVLKRFGEAMWREIAARGGHRRVTLPTQVVPGPGGGGLL